MAQIAFIGLGAMGSRMAANLLSAGHGLIVWNREAAKAASLIAGGARLASTPREAAHGADFVLSMVRDDEASRGVWTDSKNGALAGLGANATAIECSTLSLAWTHALARACADAGVAFVDAPLAGSRPQAEAKALIFFVGGEPESFARVRTILGDLGAAVHHSGGVGAGMAIKLAVNTLSAVQAGLMGELIAGLEQAGVDPARAVEIISQTPVCAPAAKIAAEMMLKGAFAPLFPIELVEKDLGYAQSAFGRHGRGGAPLTTAALALFQRAAEAGYGGEHISAIVKQYRG